MIILMILILLIGFQWLRKSRDDARLHDYRYRFFALRDRLRCTAIEDGRLGRSWLFPYLDSTISNAIHMLPDMSAWQVVALIPWAHRRQDKVSRIQSQLNLELLKPRNAPMRGIYEDMWQVVAEQFMSRHFVMTTALDGLGRVTDGVRRIRQMFRMTTVLDGLGRMADGVRMIRSILRRRERKSLEAVLLDEPNRRGASGPVATSGALGMVPN